MSGGWTPSDEQRRQEGEDIPRIPPGGTRRSVTAHDDLATLGAKCDARRCGSPAVVYDRLGGRFCRGHSYLAQAKQAEAFIASLPRSMRETAHKGSA